MKGVPIDFKLSIKHLIKLILYKNDVKLLNENIKESDGMVHLFFYRKFNVRMLII